MGDIIKGIRFLSSIQDPVSLSFKQWGIDATTGVGLRRSFA